MILPCMLNLLAYTGTSVGFLSRRRMGLCVCPCLHGSWGSAHVAGRTVDGLLPLYYQYITAEINECSRKMQLQWSRSRSRMRGWIVYCLASTFSRTWDHFLHIGVSHILWLIICHSSPVV